MSGTGMELERQVDADVRPVARGALDLERTTQGIDSLSQRGKADVAPALGIRALRFRHASAVVRNRKG